MKNISNFDLKRHRLGLTQALSAFEIVSLYKKGTFKQKLELLPLIEVLQHTEKQYREALALIFKLEKVKDSNALLVQLSQKKLSQQVASDKMRRELAPDPISAPKEIPTETSGEKQQSVPSKKTKTPSKFPSKGPSVRLVLGVTLALVVIIATLQALGDSSNNNTIPQSNSPSPSYEPSLKATVYLRNGPQNIHKYVEVEIDGETHQFLLDTGATSTLISKNLLDSLILKGFVQRWKHYKRTMYVTIANGDEVKGEVWKLPKVRVGTEVLSDVLVIVLPMESQNFLFGMSTLEQLGKPTIDLVNNKILLH